MIGPREICELSFSQPAATGKIIAATGKASTQNRLTLITENVSVRMVFISVILSLLICYRLYTQPNW